MLYADAKGRVREDSDALMAARAGDGIYVPGADELVPLPRESELFLLPGRAPLGFSRSGKLTPGRGTAVAAFVAPGYAVSAHPAFTLKPNAPVLPLFAYAAVGYARGKFWVCAAKVDDEPRQVFAGIDDRKIERGCEHLLRLAPDNRLVAHIVNNCARKYSCPAARNFALGRFEAPLPTSRVCNARCLGCISLRDPSSPVCETPQQRLNFIPTPGEIAEVMLIHAEREKSRPIFSFGQGCEGEPLMNPDLLIDAVREYREIEPKRGTVHLNSNASRPRAVAELAAAGLDSLRISMNGARPEVYEAYYRPLDYGFTDVEKSARAATDAGLFLSLNLLWFPGVTDTPAELEALTQFCGKNGVKMIQWRNLNIDPEWYPEALRAAGARPGGESLGLNRFLRELKKRLPNLRYGYFNPWLPSSRSGV